MALTLAEALPEFLADLVRRDLRPNTRRAYRYDLELAGTPWVGLSLDQITADHVTKFLDLASSAATRARRAASLRRFFRWAVRNGHTRQNPAETVPSTRLSRRLPRPIATDNERSAADQAITRAPQPYRLILTLIRETGIRPGEALGLNVGDVNLDPGREGLLIREPKNATERIAVLGPTATPRSLRGLRAHLRRLGRRPPEYPLFVSNRGTRVAYTTLRYQWRKACTEQGLVDDGGAPSYTLHQLRHTRATELVEQGHSLEIVQRVLGHLDPRSTQIYADLTSDQVRAALEKVAGRQR